MVASDITSLTAAHKKTSVNLQAYIDSFDINERSYAAQIGSCITNRIEQLKITPAVVFQIGINDPDFIDKGRIGATCSSNSLEINLIDEYIDSFIN